MKRSLANNGNPYQNSSDNQDIASWKSLLSDSTQLYYASLFNGWAYVLSISIIFVGYLSLIGWMFDVAILKSVVLGLSTMKVNTAVSFILSGTSLCLLTREQNTPNRRFFIKLFTIVTLTISALTLFQYLTGLNIGIDQLLITDFETPTDLFPGRMSPATAICFFLSSLSLLYLNIEQNRLAQLFALISGVVAYLALIGYVYDVGSLYDVFIYSTMALHTTISFLFLNLGILFTRSYDGPMSILSSTTVGGIMGRRLLPITIIIPLLCGWLILIGQKAGFYNSTFGTYLLILTSTAILFSVVYGSALSLHTIDNLRQQIVGSLASAEEKYRHIFENMMEGVFQSLPSGRIITANPSLINMLNYDSTTKFLNDLTDLKTQLFADPNQYDLFIRHLEEDGIVEEFETQLQCKDQTLIWVVMNIHAISDPNDNLQYYEGTVVNITKRKKLEEEQEKLKTQLVQSQKLSAIGQLAGSIAHDFNNLLVPIIAYAELGMMKTSSDSKLYKNLQQIKQAGEKGANLTQQILAFSRQQVLEMQTLNLNEVITDLQHLLQRLVRENIDLQFHLAPSLYYVKADKGKIEQIIMNLVLNAFDAIAGVGKIIIETDTVFLDERYVQHHLETEMGNYAMLSVSDNGSGMAIDTQQHIFEPFFTTKPRNKGTGLGLATVHGIVKQHRGHIWMYSELGVGTTFKIYLPQSIDPIQNLPEPAQEPISIHGTETILVAEDTDMVRQLVCETLEAYGYHVIEAESAAKGIQLALSHKRIDLLLTDVIMPEMNGKELYERLIDIQPDIKVLYISGYTGNVIIHHNILDEGVSFLQKPFSVLGLMQKVRETLD